MSLEGLFTDRKARKYIKDSILEAREINEGVCNKCGKTVNHLMVAFGKNLCEDCCETIINQVDEDYDTVYESAENDYIWESLISEAMVSVGDMSKLESDVNSKYNGKLADLFSDYGIPKPWNCGVIISKNKPFEILPNDLMGGKGKINKFIDDYDIKISTRALNQLAPDVDGYVTKLKGGSSASITPPAPKTPSPVKTTSQTTTKTATSSKSVTAKGNGFIVSGDETHFFIKLSSDVDIECTQTSTTTGAVNYNVKLVGSNDSMAYTVKQGKVKDMASEIMGYIKNSPCAIFTAFDDEYETVNGYILSEYPSFAFLFDDDSFDGKTITLVMSQCGKIMSKTRIALSKKDLISKASLDGKLLKALKNRLEQFYPVLFDGSMNIKTSIGKAESTFDSVDSNGKVKIHTEIANIGFYWEIAGADLKDKEQAVNSMLYELYTNHIDKIIPDWTKLKNKSKSSVSSKFTDCFCVEILADGNKVDVYLNFTLNELYDKKGIVFHVSIIDQNSGVEQPKQYIEIPYTKPGVSLETFATQNGSKIYAKYFDKSTMSQTISASAQEKIKNKSKKIVFLNHVAEILKDTFSVAKKQFKNLDLDIEQFDVNTDNKVTKVIFRVSDPFNDIASTCDELEKAISFNSSWIKLDKKCDSPSDLKKYGPSLLYKVTDIEDFSNFINLPVLESAMLEAFGIERAGRKVIGINEAYFIGDEESGYELLF